MLSPRGVLYANYDAPLECMSEPAKDQPSILALGFEVLEAKLVMVKLEYFFTFSLTEDTTTGHIFLAIYFSSSRLLPTNGRF